MERRALILLSDRDDRRQAELILGCLLAVTLLGQLFVARMAADYKKAMMEHDFAIAGYLARSGLESTRIVAAFTSDKSGADTDDGAAMLSSAGYRESTQNNLLPSVRNFHRKFALVELGTAFVCSFFFLGFLYIGVARRERRIESATVRLKRFMDGDSAVRLDDLGEGSLSRLFSAINTMATSLTALIEREKQRKQFLKDTISDISHQLKTPLAALQMYNEIISDEKTGNEVVENFTVKSRRELERMENLIQNLLKLARLDADAITLDRRIHRLRDFLEGCRDIFATRAAQEGKTISLACGAENSLRFDEVWLGEAVGNIVKNALDHTTAGDHIEISCEETLLATGIVVTDNGTGIHPEDIHHIFRRFYRSRFSNDRSGAGIGLSLAKAIVERHGGTIAVRSELGHGSEFRLVFPKLTNM